VASRDAILAALRRNAPAEPPAPSLAGLGATFTDLPAQLAAAVGAVGGTCVRVPDVAAAHAALAALPGATGATRVASLVPGVGQPTVALADVADPHELADLELAILPGRLAVAENAAVWVDGADLPHRAVFALTQHLVLVVHARDVVPDLHAAYERLAARAPGYGVFISGPSKTADIEQVLVIGAHGARTCAVILVG